MNTSFIHAIPLSGQIINLCAAIMLLLGFAMLALQFLANLLNPEIAVREKEGHQ